MPLWSPPSASNPLAGPMIGFFGAPGTTQPAGYTLPGDAGSKTLPSYTAVPQSSAYGGGLLDLTQALRLPDGNNLRLAYENLRQDHEALRKFVVQLSTDLRAMGIIA